MPEKVTEELLGVQFFVRKVELPVTDEHGNVVHNAGTGGPKVQDAWVIDLVDVNPFRHRTIQVPLTEQSRDELVRQLTGGVVLATSMPTKEMTAKL